MWRITPGQSLRFRQFGEECVLYNSLSGDTHLLSDTAIHVLSVLQRGAATRPALAASLAEALACPQDAQFDAECEALLATLAGYFLIQYGAC
jgi:PqqD family protein of HPr-rel-A system